jgi:hypothetical protein
MEPPDVIRRPCMGLPPGTPCPTHKWGTWPQDCLCYQEGIYPMKYDRTWIIVAIIAIAIMSFVGLWLGAEIAFGADVDHGCMTKAQAQAKYPKQWLYWHGAGHCWDNMRGGRSTIVRTAPPTAPVEHASDSPRMEKSASIAYPSLMAGGGTDDAMLQPEAMTTWPLVMDFDEQEPTFVPWSQRITFDK